MKKELEEKIISAFPDIFKEELMFGFQCGDGWYELIYNLCRVIDSYHKENKGVPQTIVRQIKSKFGGLRFYIAGGDSFIYESISKAESMSWNICSWCGEQKDDGLCYCELSLKK